MTLRAEIAATVGEFDLAVEVEAADELVVLYGRSGSGKSLTLRAIAGLLRPRGGRIEIGGRSVFDAATGIDHAPAGAPRRLRDPGARPLPAPQRAPQRPDRPRARPGCPRAL